jgi:hypothetical protein
MGKRLFALGAVLMVSAGFAQGAQDKGQVHASLGASYSRALTAPETLAAINTNPGVCVPETLDGEFARKIIGGIAFGLFTALEDQLPLTKFMQKQGRIPRSYATPWSCSYSKPDCGLRGLMEQWDALYQTSLVPSADGKFSTIRSVDIGPLNNGISYTCADDPPEVQFSRLIEDIGSVVAKIESATPDVSIVIADYPTVDESQLQALVDAGVTQLEKTSDYYVWRNNFRQQVCALAALHPQVRIAYPWGFKGKNEIAVMFKEFQLAELLNVPGYIGIHPEDAYMEQYATAIGEALAMSEKKWEEAEMNICK